MKRLAPLLLLLAMATAASAQPAANSVHIGYLASSPAASDRARTEAFRKGLEEIGYVEGKNLVIEWRYPDGGADRLRDLAADLVLRKVQVIVVAGATATQAVKTQAPAIPVVMTNVTDPVGLGLVASLARPGGNITGLTNASVELNAKRLELLRELAPGLALIAVLGDPGSPAYRPQANELESAAKTVGIKLRFVEVRQAGEIDKAFTAISEARAGALIVLQNPTLTRSRARIAELAAKARLPAMYPQSEFVEAGGLISYGPDIPDLHRQAAYFVGRILKGARPADLPVEQPKKFELAINLRSAKQLGLSIPPQVLFRADRTVD